MFNVVSFMSQMPMLRHHQRSEEGVLQWAAGYAESFREAAAAWILE